MKKSIIALAVAGAMTVPMMAQADATLFGGVRFELNKTDSVNAKTATTKANIGVKGSSTLDSGLTTGYYIEYAASAEGTNLSVDGVYVYVSGDFGKVILGERDLPYSDAVDRAKFMTMNDGKLGLGDDDGDSGAITYYSNNMNGLTFSAGAGNIDTEDGTSNNGYGLSVSYDADAFGITLGAGRQDGSAGVKGETVVSLGANVKLGSATLGAAFTKIDSTKRVTIGGKYSVDKLTLAAELVSNKTSGSSALRSAVVGAKFDLGGNAYVAAEYIDFNSTAEAASNADNLRVRYNVSF